MKLFIHIKLLLTNKQVATLHKAVANNLSTNIKLSTAHLSKIVKLGGFLSRLLGPLIKTGLPLMKNVLQRLAKSVFITLRLTEAVSAADTVIHKNILGSGSIALIISNKENGRNYENS